MGGKGKVKDFGKSGCRPEGKDYAPLVQRRDEDFKTGLQLFTKTIEREKANEARL